MTVTVLVVLLLVIVLVGAVGQQAGWGMGPFGAVIGVLLCVALLMYIGVLPRHF